MTIRPCSEDDVIVINGAQAGSHPAELRDGDTIDAGAVRFLYSGERSGAHPAIGISAAHLVETRSGIAHGLAIPSTGIGRDPMNGVVIRDPTASRFHADIRREAGGYVLHPHGSSGTMLNGRGLGSPERLRDGDRIEIASVELRFMSGPVPAGARTPEPAVDDESGHRPTVIQSAAMAIPAEDPGGPKQIIWLAVVIVAVLAGLYGILS